MKDEEEKKKKKDKDLYERFKKNIRKHEGKASNLESFSKNTGLTGKPNTRVEGSSDYGLYYDSKGKLTGGRGRLIRSEKEADKFFNASEKDAEDALTEDLKPRLKKIKSSIPSFGVLRPKVQEALVSSWYRGSLSGSPKTIKKINKGDFKEASKEFLDNDEYRSEKRKEQESGRKSGIASRMEETANQLSPKENSRSPQSIDQVKNTQSSILKDEEMAQDLRKPASVEEEEEKTVDAKRQEFNANAIQNTPGGQNMSEVQKRKVMKEQTNSENQVRSSAETQKKKASGEQISTKDNFMEAITFFLPSIVGGVVGHAIGGGEGAAQGVQMGMKGAADYRSAKLAREKFEHAKIQDQGDDLAKQRIEVQKSNLELRKQEVAEQRKRTTNLEDDRSLRREERKLQRQITSKESFGKRGDVKKLQDQGLMLNDIKNITTDAPEIAAGVIGFKIAKGIAGEVGNLTESERNDAQISPSFYRKMMRSGTKFLMGKLPESDVTELKKVVAVLEKRRKQKLGSIIDGFTSSRYKGDDAFRKDLRNEFGVEEKQGKGRMTDAQRQRLEELRKKHR